MTRTMQFCLPRPTYGDFAGEARKLGLLTHFHQNCVDTVVRIQSIMTARPDQSFLFHQLFTGTGCRPGL